jgi:hypothetical protein
MHTPTTVLDSLWTVLQASESKACFAHNGGIALVAPTAVSQYSSPSKKAQLELQSKLLSFKNTHLKFTGWATWGLEQALELHSTHVSLTLNSDQERPTRSSQ